jgi:hypothetical protein
MARPPITPSETEPDALDELIEEGERRSPGFAARVEEALVRRVMAREASEPHIIRLARGRMRPLDATKKARAKRKVRKSKG